MIEPSTTAFPSDDDPDGVPADEHPNASEPEPPDEDDPDDDPDDGKEN